MSKFETTGIHLKRAILLYATDLEHHTALDEIVKGHSAPPLSVKLPDQYFIEFVWQSVTYRKKIGKMYTKYSHHKAVSTSCGENVWILCWQSHDWKSCQLNYQLVLLVLSLLTCTNIFPIIHRCWNEAIEGELYCGHVSGCLQ